MEYHPYKPAPGGICAECQAPAMSPQHIVGYQPQAPAPAVAPVSTPAPTQEATNTAVATTAPVQGDLQVDEWLPPEQQTPDERAETARLASNVELAFPAIGFIDPVAELEKMLRIVQTMPQDLKLAYPEKIRAAILAHEAGKGPEVSDEDLALAIFIQRTVATPLTEEELEAKATGRKKKAEPTAKSKKAMSSADQLRNLLG